MHTLHTSCKLVLHLMHHFLPWKGVWFAGVLVFSPAGWTTQRPMQVGHVVWVINKFGGTSKGGCFGNGTNHTIDWVLVMDVMQIRSTAFAMLVHKKNLVVRVESDDAVFRVETRGKTGANMIANHDRITNMQVSHWRERRFRAACTGHADIQSGKSPSSLQGFQGDVTCISTQVTSLDPKQFVQGCDRVLAS